MATCSAQWRTVRKGGDPRTDQEGTTRTPGWHPEEKATLVTATQPTKVLSNQRGLRQYEKGRGPKDPTVRREGTREPRRRGAICWCGLSRQPQARTGQTVGEVRPTSLPSSSTVVTVSAGLHFNDWCLVVTVQTTVEVPQLLGVPVEIPQVQFLDKFDTPVTHASVVCSSTRWSMSLLCCAMGFRRCSQ